jgi:heptosyltransferase-3
MRKKILVLRGGALGDFIVTLPALALLRRLWPDARIELTGNATAAALALAPGLLDRVHSQHDARWAALYGDAPLPADFTRELASFDLILSFWPDPDGELGRRLPLHAGQTFLAGAALPACAPAAAHYCAPLHGTGLEPASLWYALAAPFPDARLIAIHPGSGSPSKNWPLSRWTELCVWLTQEHQAELLIVTGEADSAAAGAFARFGRSAHNLRLSALVAKFTRCRLFLGHDSGVSHLAAACGVPSLLLFGPTDPAIWAPPAPHVTVLRPGVSLDSISLSHVQQAVRTAFAGGK